MKRVLTLGSFIVILFAILMGMAGTTFALNEDNGVLKIFLGEPMIIPVTNPTRIVIGNPSIVDVSNVTRQEFTIMPKAVGKTTLTFWDIYGEQFYTIKVLPEDLRDAQKKIHQLLKTLDMNETSTAIDEEQGKILLLGNVKAAQDREKIAVAMGTLKDKVIDLLEVKEETTVIEIDVQLLELDKDATKTLGFSWPGSINFRELSSPGIADKVFDVEDSKLSGTTTGTKWSTLFKVIGLNRDAFSWKLDALIQEGKARILSRPRLTCQSGKEAEMLVGGEIPILTSCTGENNTCVKVEYKEFGIKLKIKPLVNKDDQIKLALNVEVSEISGEAITLGDPSAPTARAYPFSKRNASTELYLGDGQTLSIGGLIKQKDEEDLRKMPFLADVPMLGIFFRQKALKTGGGEGQRGNTELFIAMTPHIVSRGGVLSTKKEDVPLPAISQNNKIASSVADYAKIVQNRVLQTLTYPALARQSGFQGVVKLSLHVAYTGKLLDVLVKEPSAYKVLDDHAINVARQIDTYPPFPPSVKQENLWIDVPIEYHID